VSEFFKTRMGHTFIEGTVPRLIESISRLAKAMERSNELKEIEVGEVPMSKVAKEFTSGEGEQEQG